ncbi:MAG TPA: NAD(P)H-binding protein, partial [Gemmatimonadales bacterium]|nr:NAD(P)H-binding protein [Gemmatimonadales bacterium]
MTQSITRLEPRDRTGSRTWNIFVAGGTGAIGRRVLPLLVEAGHQVTAVGRTPERRGELAKLGARPADTNLFDLASVRRSLGDAEVIINLATAVPPGFRVLIPRAWREMDRVRREVSANLVAAAIAGGRVERLVQEAFAPIYPDRGD